jgi:hypothetical protein
MRMRVTSRFLHAYIERSGVSIDVDVGKRARCTMDSIPVEYRGCELSAVVTHGDGAFSSMLLIEKPGGVREAFGPFRSFATAQAAAQCAFAYGRAEIDGLHAHRATRLAVAGE